MHSRTFAQIGERLGELRSSTAADGLRHGLGVAAGELRRGFGVAAEELRRRSGTVRGGLRRTLSRRRTEGGAALAAFALIVGLSAPASGVAEATGHTSSYADVIASTDVTSNAPALVPPQVTGSLAPAQASAPSAVAPAPVAPTSEELHPVPVTAPQQTFTPTHEQLANAKAIVDAGKELGLSPRAWTIAVATSLQESNLRNLGHLGASNDHDSLGLFQQRPSTGWGTPAQVTDPSYAATAFYKRLVQVPGWDTLPLTRAAQKVQVSAYPNHYAKHEQQAGEIIEALYGSGPYADLAADLR